MNFQFIQEAIQNGFESYENRAEDIYSDDIIDFLTQTLEVDDALELYEHSHNTQGLIKKLKNSNMLTDDNFKEFLIKCDSDIDDIYKILENEGSIYYSDIKKLSSKKQNFYLELLEGRGKECFNSEEKELYNFIQRVKDPKTYLENKMKDSSLSKEEMELYLNEYADNLYYDHALLINSNFMYSFNTLNKWDQIDFFDGLFENETSEQFYEIAKVYEDKFTNFEFKKYFPDEANKEKLKQEELNDKRMYSSNRINSAQCKRFCIRNNIAGVTINDGHVGLEDMTFAVLRIDGDSIPESTFCKRAWIDGRNFGDNNVTFSFFLEQLISKCKYNKGDDIYDNNLKEINENSTKN